jgi:hypothetical protein
MLEARDAVAARNEATVMARGRAIIRFCNGNRITFADADQFVHGCGSFLLVYVRTSSGQVREISFCESDVKSTEFVAGNQDSVGFRKKI